MSLTLYFHPLSSFCWKALLALYDSGIAFTPRPTNLGDPADRAELQALWPPGRFPVLHDLDRGQVMPESTILIEYLAQHHAGAAHLLPADPQARLQVRLWDRVCDGDLQQPLQKIVGDRLRQPDERDAKGVADARAALQRTYPMFERQLAGRRWLASEDFSLADCAALPALFYTTIVEPPPGEMLALRGYLERLLARPAAQRVLHEARPWFQYFPFVDDMPARYREGA